MSKEFEDKSVQIPAAKWHQSEGLWLFVTIIILSILFAGDPDLMDAIIHNMMGSE